MSKTSVKGKRAQSRRIIMHSAKTLFEKNGIEDVTFGDIAEASGVCRTTVFNYFSGIEALKAALFTQEIEDLQDYLAKSGRTGVDLIKAFFDKLIEDTAYYPVLTYRLAASAVLQGDTFGSGISAIEDMIWENLSGSGEERDLKAIAIMGAYYGLVNHYHSLSKEFDAEGMKIEFHQLLNLILGGQTNE